METNQVRHGQHLSLGWLYDSIVSMLPILMSSLSFKMKNKKISKTSKLCRHSVSLHIITDSNFESHLKWRIQRFSPIQCRSLLKILIHQFSTWSYDKNHLGLQGFQLQCRRTSTYLKKMLVQFFLKVLVFKRNENSVFLFKNIYNTEKDPILYEK